MNWAWGQALPPTPKLVLMALADAADDHGVCWPSAATLARKCSVSTRTVRRILQELVQRGLIDTEARFRKDGSRTANRYVMALRGGDTMSPGPVTRNRAPTPGCLGPCDIRDTPRTTTRSVTESPPLPFSASVAPAIGTCPTADVVSSERTSSFDYPWGLSPLERTAAHKMLVTLSPVLAQEVLDELGANLERGAVRGGSVPYLRALVTRARAGTFVPGSGLRITERRKARLQAEARLRQAEVASRKEAVRQAGDATQGAKDNALLHRLAAIRNRCSGQRGN